VFIHLRLVDVGSIVGIGPQSRRIDSFVKSAFLVMNFPLMKSSSFTFVCLCFTFQKANGNASGFHKYPRADEIQTRSNPHKSRISLPARNELDELSNSSAIRK